MLHQSAPPQSITIGRYIASQLSMRWIFSAQQNMRRSWRRWWWLFDAPQKFSQWAIKLTIAREGSPQQSSPTLCCNHETMTESLWKTVLFAVANLWVGGCKTEYKITFFIEIVWLIELCPFSTAFLKRKVAEHKLQSTHTDSCRTSAAYECNIQGTLT